MSQASEYSFEKITKADLARLAKLALTDLESLFIRHPHTSGLYQDRLLALCLCQGAADHYVNREHGVKDFDVWAFFREHPRQRFPPRRIGHADFGHSKFGRHPDDEGYKGRRVDIIGRSIKVVSCEDAMAAIQRYFRERRTTSARLLSQRPPWSSIRHNVSAI
jgi:hypothetical protein